MTTLGSPLPLVVMAQGTSRLIKIAVRDENGNAFDLTGGQAVFWVGKSVSAAGEDVIITKKTGGGGITLVEDAENLWTVNITILPEDTEDEPSRCSYYCECRVWDQSGNEYVVASGAFELDPSLTVSAVEP